jgi:hypothetical protein
VEKANEGPDEWHNLKIPDRALAIVSYHVKLLHDAGLLEATDLSDLSESCLAPRSLTWTGHEYLDAARNDTVWNKALSTLNDKAPSVPFEIVKAVVIKTRKDFFGLG